MPAHHSAALRVAWSLVAAALAVAPASLAHGQDKVNVVFSAGPTGGSWTPLAAAVSQVIKKRFPE
jgi:hypothetical protein